MGFEIHPMGNPDYDAKLSVWEWSRFLDLLLYTGGAINMETLHNNIVHITMMETQALNVGKSDDELRNFDVTEHKNNIAVEDDAERNRMEILDTDLPDGRKVFHGAVVALTKESKMNEEQMVHMCAVSIAAFQHMEDKLFAAREILPALRDLGRNGTIVEEEGVWDIYDCFLNVMYGMPDMLRMTMFPQQKRRIKQITKKKSEELKDFISENIQPHDVGNWPRLFGVLCQTISDEVKLFIA